MNGRQGWWPAISLALLSAPVVAAPGDTELISQLEGAPVVSTDPTGPSFTRMARSVSADGRYVTFSSQAANLVNGDTNGTEDVFVHDRDTDSTTRVSVDSAGNQGNSASYESSISADGRYVAFSSRASDLVGGDTNGQSDVFVHDRATGATARVSTNSAGIQGNNFSQHASLSGDGRYVAFSSFASNLVSGDTNGREDVFVHDRDAAITSRVSLDSGGAEANNQSYEPSISADGRYVAFSSYASDLVSGDTNLVDDVFVHDRDTGTTTRISVDNAGLEGTSISYEPSISADGRYVAFSSRAGNLVGNDSNNAYDIFVRDLASRTTSRASLSNSGAQGNGDSFEPTISADGRHIAFYSNARNLVGGDSNLTWDVFVRDLTAGTTARVSISGAGIEGNSQSYTPSISADGRLVAFYSYASNLVSGDAHDEADVFMYDRDSGEIDRVDAEPFQAYSANGHSYTGEPSVSEDGRFVAFHSDASNLVGGDTNDTWDVFVRDRGTGTTTRVSVDSSGNETNDVSYEPSISADGRYIAFRSYASNLVSGDGNGTWDVFVHDRNTGTTTRASLNSQGFEGAGESRDPSLSADGRYVAFTSLATNLVSEDNNGAADIFVRDRNTGITTRASLSSTGLKGDNTSFEPSISADGRYVAFWSLAKNLVTGDTNNTYDVFVRDRVAGTTKRVSRSSSGVQGNNQSNEPAISANGRYVAFASYGSNLVSGDTNGHPDIFVHENDTGLTSRVSLGSNGAQANAESFEPTISADGRYVAFWSNASNLVTGDINGQPDIFVHHRDTGATTRISLDSAAAGSDFGSYGPSVSLSGAFVAFMSDATNLTPSTPDANGRRDVFLRQIASVNRAPIAHLQSVTTDEDTATGVTLTGDDPDGDSLTFAVVNGPATGALTGTAPALTYTPFDDVSGADSFTFTVSDGDKISTPATVDITVNAMNDAPAATGQSVVIEHETATGITLGAIDPDGDSLNFTVANEPAFGILSGTAPNLIYTPNAAFSGADSFSFIASDSIEPSLPATVDIAVSPRNDKPTADAQNVATDEDIGIAIVLTGSDPEGAVLTYLIGTGPSHGSLTGSPPDVNFTPAAQFSGADSFTFTVGDGAKTSAPATVTIIVDPVNDVPAANAQSVTTAEDTAVAITLTGNDVDGDTLVFAVQDAPDAGVLTGTAPNLIYTPAAGFAGSDSFGFTVSDGIGVSAPASVGITVNEAPPPTQPGTLQFSSATYSVNENAGTATVTVTRAGGDNGAVSVAYSTPAVTATPGADYRWRGSTLTWADGNATPRTFSVPILDDTQVEGAETVNLVLKTPTNGASLGTPSTASLSIVDDDAPPPAGAVCGGLAATIVGTAAGERIDGTAGADVIHGLDGNDQIYGLGGNDILCGGGGSDTLRGGPGVDTLYGDASWDVLFGEDGNDTLNGGDGKDTLRGGAGNDRLFGDLLDDGLFGDAGNDTLNGGTGTDSCNGGTNTPVASGGGDTATTCEQQSNIP